MTAAEQHDGGSDAPASTQDQRVSELVGDRICLKCGYNLVGQPVLRERHYDMLIARCPECGTVAAMQEYPMLGRWANRWASLLAALWFLFLIAILFINGLTIGMLSHGIATNASMGYMRWLGQHQYDWMKANDDPDFEKWYGSNQFDSSQYFLFFDRDWWNAQDPDDLLAEAGGWTGAADWTALQGWTWIAFWGVVFGVFWAVMLMRFGRLRLLAFGLVVVLASVATTSVFTFPPWSLMFPGSIIQIANDALIPPFILLSLAFSAVPLWIGLLVGRPLMRLMIRVLLPPRQASALAILWTCDGKDLPQPDHASSST